MGNRNYEGDPIDVSWNDLKDRPYKGDGETIEVIDNTPHNQRKKVELPSDFNLGEKSFRVFLTLAQIGPAPIRDLAETADITKKGAKEAVKKMHEFDLAAIEYGTGKYGADVIYPAVSPNAKFVFSNGITSDIIPSDTHPIRLTKNQRQVLAHAARYPTKSQVKIAESVGISQVSVSRTLRDHGDPRQEIEHVSVGLAQSELELVEERIEHLENRRSELKSQIKSGEGYRSKKQQ